MTKYAIGPVNIGVNAYNAVLQDIRQKIVKKPLIAGTGGHMRLIDADKSKDIVSDAGFWEAEDKEVAIYCIDATPTIDAVEVVRCKDCNYHDNKGHYGSYVGSDVHYCTKLKFGTRDDEYCSYGQRKENR